MGSPGGNQEVPDNELLLIVDIHDRVIGSAAKPVVHAARQWHRQSYIIILDGQENVLLQKRSLNRRFDPGRWAASVSGHVTGADSYLVSAQREVREEIGIEPPELVYLGKVLTYMDSSDEICGGPSAVFVGLLDRDATSLTRQESEVAEVAWFSIDEVELALTTGHELYHEDDLIEFSEEFRAVYELFLDRYRASVKKDLENTAHL